MVEVDYDIPLLIFEGADVCGKTTAATELMKKHIGVDDLDSLYYKFPSYDLIFGDEILEHLKNFNPEDYSEFQKYEAFQEIKKFSLMQFANKSAALTDVLEWFKVPELSGDFYWRSENNLGFIIFDRFVLSQFIYDHAWRIKFSHNNALGIDKDETRAWFTNDPEKNIPFNRAKLILEMYSKIFTNIRTVYFKSSKYIKNLSEMKKKQNRRIDSYDSMSDYQKEVKALFESYMLGAKSSKTELLGNRDYIVVDPDNIYKNIYTEDLKQPEVYESIVKGENKYSPSDDIVTEAFTKYINYLDQNIIQPVLKGEI